MPLVTSRSSAAGARTTLPTRCPCCCPALLPHPPYRRQDEFGATGVSGELFSTIDKALDERTIGHNPERLCLLKGGMVYSNAVTTVSPNYAAETLHGGEARAGQEGVGVGAAGWGWRGTGGSGALRRCGGRQM